MRNLREIADKINFFKRINIEEKNKKILKMFFIFFGLIIGMSVILVTLTLLSRPAWKCGLAKEMQVVLSDYDDSQYTVGKYLRLDSNFSTSTAVYSLLKKNSKNDEKYYGVIVRIPSLLGPVPAVFVYSEKNKAQEVHFAGYAVDNGKASNTMALQANSNVMKYWKNMIPKIIEQIER